MFYIVTYIYNSSTHVTLPMAKTYAERFLEVHRGNE